MKSSLAYVAMSLATVILSCGGGGDDDGDFLEIVETAPTNGAESFPVEGRIAVRVSAAIDPVTLSSETFFLTNQDGEVVPSTVSVLDEEDADPAAMGTAAELTPEAPLTVLTNFTVNVTTGLASTAGSTLEEDFEWTFTTIDAQWGSSELIEAEDTNASSSGQQIAIDEQLNAIAVWQLEDQVGTAIYANRYTRRDLWGAAEPIDDGSGGTTNPALAVDATGNGFAVWERLGGGGPTRNIWTNRYDVELGEWGAPALLQNGTVTDAGAASVAADPAGNAIAVWTQTDLDTGREVVRAIRYEPSVGWGSAETIGAPSTFLAGPRTAVGMDDAGNAIAVWNPPAGPAGQGGRVLWANRYTPSSGWGEEQLIKSDETTSADAFQLDVGADGTAFVIWVQDNGDEQAPRDDIWGARFSAGSWSEPDRIDTYNDGDKTGPDIAVDGTGTGYAVWSQADPDFANIWAALCASGAEWGAPALIEPPNEDPADDGDATRPRVDVNRAGNVLVVWRQIWDSWGSVWSNRRDPGTDWLTAERIEDLPEVANLPIVAVDEGRHAHALWLHTESNDNMKVRTNRFE